MDKTAASRLTAFCQMLHGSNVDGIRFCMVRFAIIGDGEGGGIDYNIRLYFLEKFSTAWRLHISVRIKR